MHPLVQPEELAALGAVLVDARSGAAGRAAYAAAHLRGAVHADLDSELAAPAPFPERGGRHPLPDASTFAAWLGRVGIGPERAVVVYDDQGGANAAARLWWMLRAIGHAQVAVLDGGLAAAHTAGLELTAESPSVLARAPYPSSAWRGATADIDEVDQARRDPSRRVIDSRAAFRFRGEREPIDPIAGHIPGAINAPYEASLDATGRFLPADTLRAQLAGLLGDVPPDRVIVHCGSGVTACHTLLALELAGLPGAKLYVGSWSEWCRQDRPRA